MNNIEHKLKKLNILGFGNQAKAWALNLRDSNVEVEIFVRSKNQSYQKAKDLKFSVKLISEIDQEYEHQYFAVLTPDHTHKDLTQKISQQLKSAYYIYAHGYSLNQEKQQLKNNTLFDHILLAPKSIASEIRYQYETGGKLGAVYSLEMVNNSRKENHQLVIFDLAKKLGITSGPYLVSVAQETQADLFSEQSLLCSLIPYGALLSYNHLRENGISKELAYLECWYEVKLIVDTMIKVGPEKFFDLISPNALIGSEKARKLLLDQDFKNKLAKIFDEIAHEQFSKEVDGSDIEFIRKKVKEFWQQQELTQTHNIMELQLFQ